MERKGRGRNRRRGSEEWEGVGVKEGVEGRGGCSSQLQLLQLRHFQRMRLLENLRDSNVARR